MSLTRACAAKVFNVGNIDLGFGNLAGCLIDCSIFSAANWTSYLGLVNFGCIICSNLLADNSVSDFELNLTGNTVFDLAMNLAPDGSAVVAARLLIFLFSSIEGN